MNTETIIKLPNGDSIRSSAIVAVRLGDKREAYDLHKYELKPRVIVDFLVGEHGNCIVLDCETDEERNALAASITEQL